MIANYIHWSPRPEIFDLGFIAPRWYGLLWALSFLAGYYLLSKMFKKEKESDELLDSLTMYMIIATVVGARLGHCLFYDWAYFSQHPLEILMIWHGGLASHGAAIGVFIGLYLFSRKYKKSYLWTLDRIAIVSALGGGFVRVGNLMNSEIIGKVTDVPWAFVFERIDMQPRHPSQIYEALFCFLLFGVLYRYYQKNIRHLKDGVIFAIFMVALFIFRFCIEFTKDIQVAFEKGMDLNMGQWLSIPFVAVGIYLLITRLKSRPKNYLKVENDFEYDTKF